MGSTPNLDIFNSKICIVFRKLESSSCRHCRCTNHVTRQLIKREAVLVRSFSRVSIVCVDVVDFQHIADMVNIEDVVSCLDELVAIINYKCAETSGVFKPRTFDQTFTAVFGN